MVIRCYVYSGPLERYKPVSYTHLTVHQDCMSHAKNKFVKASKQGGEPTAERFSEILKEFFMRERKYDCLLYTSRCV